MTARRNRTSWSHSETANVNMCSLIGNLICASMLVGILFQIHTAAYRASISIWRNALKQIFNAVAWPAFAFFLAAISKVFLSLMLRTFLFRTAIVKYTYAADARVLCSFQFPDNWAAMEENTVCEIFISDAVHLISTNFHFECDCWQHFHAACRIFLLPKVLHFMSIPRILIFSQ